jgi:hypothetical protein
VLQPAVEWGLVFALDAERPGEATLGVTGVSEDPFVETFVDEVLASLIGGDPNGNGAFGADELPDDEHARLIEPGSLSRSYLWGRVTGTVPGTRMPLANQPLTDAEYVALACFIETLTPDTQADSAIDYDSCAFAQAPVSFAP